MLWNRPKKKSICGFQRKKWCRGQGPVTRGYMEKTEMLHIPTEY